jgi:hypothetical protein
MDERLEKALAFSNYRATIENRRKSVRRRFETMMVVHKNNGMFQADQDTIAFVDALIREGHNDAVLIDAKSNPVDIDDLKAFRTELFNTYFAATNEYATEMRKLAKARDVKKAMDW